MNRLFVFFIFLAICKTGEGQIRDRLQSYTPSSLLREGQIEIKSFQNLYYQTRSFGQTPFIKVDDQGRERISYFTSINQVLYGLQPNLNIGFDVWISHVNEQVTGNTRSRWGVSGVGPKIKISPFRSLQGLAFQSSLLFPLSSDLEGRHPAAKEPFLFLAFDRFIWLNQIFYDHRFNSQWQVFLQGAFWYSFVRKSFVTKNFIDTQFNAFLSYFPSSILMLYGMLEYTPRHYDYDQQQAILFNIYYVQAGLGLKYQFSANIETELLYTNFFMGSEGNGAGHTLNLGLRIIR